MKSCCSFLGILWGIKCCQLNPFLSLFSFPVVVLLLLQESVVEENEGQTPPPGSFLNCVVAFESSAIPVSPSDESRHAKTVFRDELGRKRDLKQERLEQRKRAEETSERDEQYAKWGRG